MKLNCNKWTLMLVGLLISSGLLAQREVTGTVTDAETGEGLIGANILVDGTSTGTITDFDGNYTLTVPEGRDILIFSYTGYAEQRISIGTNTEISIQMSAGEVLEEVVVIGYGSVKKDDLTGVVTKVDSKDFNKGAIVSPENLIAGKVAGVQIQNNTGEPGAGLSIRIRGGTSINASNEPLFVIDGVPIDNSTLAGSRNPLNFLNPNDIESYNVLKDASATAIYGSRGANGVIIITTKKGKAGEKARFSYDGSFAVSTIDEGPQNLSADEFRSAVTFFAPDRLELLGNANTNWFDESTQTGTGQNHNLSVTGGGASNSYRISAGYQNLEGVIRTAETERINYSVNLSQKLLQDNLDVNINLKGALTNDRYDPGVVGATAAFDPTQPILDPTNTRFGGYFVYDNGLAPKNPVASIEQIDRRGQGVRNLASIDFNYKFDQWVRGLSARLNLAYDDYRSEFNGFTPTTFFSNDFNGEALVENAKRNSSLLESYLNYKFDVGVHSFNLTGGYSYQDFNNEFTQQRAQDLSTDIFGTANLAVAENLFTDRNVVENRLISFYGRIIYELNDKYLLTATLRRDGSTRFGPENRWGWFPSAAVAWRILEEDWLQGLNDVFSDLKLRVSYGITGNQDIDDFAYLPTFRLSDGQTRYQFGDSFITTARPNAYDPRLKWEETSSLNVGLDFGFSNGRISGSVEYYVKNTEDLLFTVDVPAGTNLSDRVLTNIGEVQNQGVELVLNTVAVDRPNFAWDFSFNAAFNQNEVLEVERTLLRGDISGGVGNQVQTIQVGQPVDAFLLYDHLEGDDGNPIPDAGDGDLATTYADLNGDGIVNDDDKRAIGNPAPDLLLGFTSNFAVRDFDLSFTLRANLGQEVYNNNASVAGYGDRIAEGAPNGFLNNPHPSILTNGFIRPQYFSDVYLEDASFLRLDNITLGYTFSKLANTSLRLYATAQNVFVLTEYSGLDPEVGAIDNAPFPRPRTFVFGLSLGF